MEKGGRRILESESEYEHERALLPLRPLHCRLLLQFSDSGFAADEVVGAGLLTMELFKSLGTLP